jgi:hypothetical protein
MIYNSHRGAVFNIDKQLVDHLRVVERKDGIEGMALELLFIAGSPS